MIWTLKARLAKAHKSLTIWFNGAMLTFMLYIPELKYMLSEVQPYITPDLYKWFSLVLVIGNILLRFKTTKALEAK